MIDSKLLSILACPGCQGKVSQDGSVLVCQQCSRRYPIREEIPIMLLDECEAPIRQDSGRDQDTQDD